ncbi:MAG TPA: hypothetical protein VJU58_13880 [Microbacterium sp.]|nr:hypothetical protein [Microbacterium sp.]
MKTTTFRSHWIDNSGRCYDQRHPHRYELYPVLNLDEVRAWLDLSTSDVMRAAGFPSSDTRTFYVRQFLDPALPSVEVERLAPLICEELTDEVARYYQGSGRDWRSPFLKMRERWPAPPAPSAPSEIRNLTPHPIVVGEFTFPPSGTIARAIEESTPGEPIGISIPDPTGAPTDRIRFEIPTSTVRYTKIVDLPDPEPGVYLIVSMVIPPVAAERGRWTGDLLVPGEQVRDPSGRIVGCRSLRRAEVRQ